MNETKSHSASEGLQYIPPDSVGLQSVSASDTDGLQYIAPSNALEPSLKQNRPPETSGLPADSHDETKRQGKTVLGIRRKIFWCAVGLLLLLLIVAVVAGVIGNLLHNRSEIL